MTGIAACSQNPWVGVVDAEYGSETVGAMTTATICGGSQVRGHCGRLGECVDTIGFIVA